MNYEINVSLNGSHLFATHERSITSSFDLKKVYEEIKKRFPESEGFAISVSERVNYSKSINVDTI